MLTKVRSHGLAIVAFSLFLLGFGLGRQPRLAVVDMKQALHQPAILLGQSSLSKAAQKTILARYAKLLPAVINDYGKSHRVTVMSAPILYGRAIDITNTLITETLEKVKQHG